MSIRLFNKITVFLVGLMTLTVGFAWPANYPKFVVANENLGQNIKVDCRYNPQNMDITTSNQGLVFEVKNRSVSQASIKVLYNTDTRYQPVCHFHTASGEYLGMVQIRLVIDKKDGDIIGSYIKSSSLKKGFVELKQASNQVIVYFSR